MWFLLKLVCHEFKYIAIQYIRNILTLNVISINTTGKIIIKYMLKTNQ